jgi:hypothetical protein
MSPVRAGIVETGPAPLGPRLLPQHQVMTHQGYLHPPAAAAAAGSRTPIGVQGPHPRVVLNGPAFNAFCLRWHERCMHAACMHVLAGMHVAGRSGSVNVCDGKGKLGYAWS